jgi:hypothetical protein
MTAAWAHYVDSNNLLNELRGLTKNYPFSSDLLDEAKVACPRLSAPKRADSLCPQRLVVSDPASVRSWNYCWLVLLKIEKEYCFPTPSSGPGCTDDGSGDSSPDMLALWLRSLPCGAIAPRQQRACSNLPTHALPSGPERCGRCSGTGTRPPAPPDIDRGGTRSSAPREAAN